MRRFGHKPNAEPSLLGDQSNMSASRESPQSDSGLADRETWPPRATDADDEAKAEDRRLDEVLQALRTHGQADFSGYRRNMVWRRVKRRMGLCRIHSTTEYLAHLCADPEEARALFQDLLIGVTRFFRDPEAFAVLAQALFAPGATSLLGARSIRVWVPCCCSARLKPSVGRPRCLRPCRNPGGCFAVLARPLVRICAFRSAPTRAASLVRRRWRP